MENLSCVVWPEGMGAEPRYLQAPTRPFEDRMGFIGPRSWFEPRDRVDTGGGPAVVVR